MSNYPGIKSNVRSHSWTERPGVFHLGEVTSLSWSNSCSSSLLLVLERMR